MFVDAYKKIMKHYFLKVMTKCIHMTMQQTASSDGPLFYTECWYLGLPSTGLFFFYHHVFSHRPKLLLNCNQLLLQFYKIIKQINIWAIGWETWKKKIPLFLFFKYSKCKLYQSVIYLKISRKIWLFKKNNSSSFKVNMVIMKMLKRNLQHLQQS